VIRFVLHRTALKREDVEFSMPLHEARTGKENEAEVEEGQEDKVIVQRQRSSLTLALTRRLNYLDLS
jgi:hypothetical protein